NLLSFKLKYAGELFLASSIENLLDVIKEVLKQISNNPRLLENSVSYLNKAEYEKIINKWSGQETIELANKTVSQLFEERVEKLQENIALIYKDKRISYRVLNERANQLAHYLKL